MNSKIECCQYKILVILLSYGFENIKQILICVIGTRLTVTTSAEGTTDVRKELNFFFPRIPMKSKKKNKGISPGSPQLSLRSISVCNNDKSAGRNTRVREVVYALPRKVL